MITDYDILTGLSPDELTEKIKDAIKNGWQTTGGLVQFAIAEKADWAKDEIVPTHYMCLCQAVVKMGRDRKAQKTKGDFFSGMRPVFKDFHGLDLCPDCLQLAYRVKTVVLLAQAAVLQNEPTGVINTSHYELLSKQR